MAVRRSGAPETRQQVVDQGPCVVAQLDDLELAVDAGVGECARGRRRESVGEQPRRRGLAQPRGDDHQPSLRHATLTGTVAASGTSAVGAVDGSVAPASATAASAVAASRAALRLVGGRLGHVRGLERRTPAQHRNHERAEHLELLQGHARRQAGMVDEEQPRW
jgi:hypothetical protein